jgi:5'-nucleotidase
VTSIILCDLDGVVVDLLSSWCAEYNKQYKDNMSIQEFGSSFGNTHKVVKPECGEKVYEIFEAPGFVAGLNPFVDAVDGFESLCRKPDWHVSLLSSYSGHENVAHDKMVWIKKYLPFYDPERTILTKEKWLVYGNILIDDSFKNLVKWKEYMDSINDDVHIPIMPDAPHNENDDVEGLGGYRTFDWNGILECVYLVCGV